MNAKQIKTKENRGFISNDSIDCYLEMGKESIQQMLVSVIPQERTIAAKIIEKKCHAELIPELCKQLSVEKHLYPKIAISETLSSFGVAALPELLNYVGSIGKNQHSVVSEKNFNKFSYPLPRDIVARTIAKMGDVALPELISFIQRVDKFRIDEVIDSIGFISFYSGNKSAFETLAALYKRTEDDLTRWKLIRAFSAFKNDKTVEICVKTALDITENEGIRVEAIRSLSLICSPLPNEIIELFPQGTERIKEMINLVQSKAKAK